MSERLKNRNALEPPSVAANPKAVEVLRVWTLPGRQQELTLQTTWKDPAAWGLLLADLARHAAQAYANEGHEPNIVLARIREGFDAEWSNPTDKAKDITLEFEQ